MMEKKLKEEKRKEYNKETNNKGRKAFRSGC